jgi:hypothetical protein
VDQSAQCHSVTFHIHTTETVALQAARFEISATDMTDASNMSIYQQGCVYLSIIS